MKTRTAILLLAASVLSLQATHGGADEAEEERANGWSEPRGIRVPSDVGIVKGLVRTRRLPRNEEKEESDPREAKLRLIEFKSVYLPQNKLLWIGASAYQTFAAIKNNVAAFYLTPGADLSISVLSAPLPDSADPDEKLREEMDVRFQKIVKVPLRYEYWISLRRLFGAASFRDEQNRVNWVPRISAVSVNRTNVVVTLSETNGLKSTLTFDADLRVIGATRDGQAVQIETPVVPRKLTSDKD